MDGYHNNSALQHDLDLMYQNLRRSSHGRGLCSVRGQNNIRKALRYLDGSVVGRALPLRSWERCLSISPQVFVLFSASFSADTINRKGDLAIRNLILVLEGRRNSLDQESILWSLVQQYKISTNFNYPLQSARCATVQVSVYTAKYLDPVKLIVLTANSSAARSIMAY